MAKETGLIMDAYFRVGIWLCDEVDTEQLRAQIEDYSSCLIKRFERV